MEAVRRHVGRQFGHLPHHGNEITTWSPGATLRTAEPTASTMPPPSWPNTAGYGVWIIAVASVQVGLAHAACHDADEHLVGARVGQLELLDREGAEFFARHRGGDQHGLAPFGDLGTWNERSILMPLVSPPPHALLRVVGRGWGVGGSLAGTAAKASFT